MRLDRIAEWLAPSSDQPRTDELNLGLNDDGLTGEQKVILGQKSAWRK